jgi:ABC-2 type transport system ATP-binding protein
MGVKEQHVNIIETQGLVKSFKTRQAKGKPQMVEAVRGINMTVKQGEIFGFLGPNGAGKTTTLRMLSTLLEPDAGSATVAGHDLRREPGRVRERIGYVSQAGGTDPHLTGRENLVLQGRMYGMKKAAARQRAAELIQAVDLESFADRQAKTYSGGQKRRLDMALGMAHRPALLYLDEPTTGLDPQSRARMWEEVKRLRENGTTVFLTTHYLDEADALCDRLAIIDNGQMVAEGTPDTLKRQIAGDVVTLGLEMHNGAVKHAHEILNSQPFVREVHPSDGQIQL